MKSSGLIIAAIALAVLSGILYWSNHHAPSNENSKSSAETPAKLLTLNEPDVVKIEIRRKGAEDAIIRKNSSGKWEITAPESLNADQTAVSELLSNLSSLSSDRLIEEKPGNFKLYGLTEPVLEVAVTDKKNKIQKLLIGDDTPTGSAVYAALAADPRVFTLASYSKTSLDKSPKDLRDKRLVAIESDKIIGVELIAKKQNIQFGRNKDGWQILKPKPLRADGNKIEDLLRKLTDAKMDLSGSETGTQKAALAFASGKPIATARLTSASGAQQLQVRKSGENYYAKSGIVDGAYKVASDLGEEMGKSVEDFRNKKLFDFGFDDPNKIEMRDASKAFVLSRTKQDWRSEGKRMDTASVQYFEDKIRDLTASKFVESGFGAAQIEITVTSKDGQRMEKVLISKSANDYLAKRENEPALYYIDGKTIEELRKAAGDVKVAVTASN